MKTTYKIRKTPKGWRVFVLRDGEHVNSFGMPSWEACRDTVWNSLGARFQRG